LRNNKKKRQRGIHSNLSTKMHVDGENAKEEGRYDGNLGAQAISSYEIKERD